MAQFVRPTTVDAYRLLCLSFFFYSSVAPRVLPSFPTRPLFRSIAGDGAYNRTLTPLGFQTERRDLWEAPKDRKSTRLNSSHSQISYAVFCLKKKRRSYGRAQSMPTASAAGL